ncbi:hepatoma-derived growth factor-related protein 2-like [Thalassophryne amazonica]|uniref:hepatoma-derived growth factor-related protein 2-like n=1 Tax=Thalassophryne amazonica TaxID=390379 RepID=UPI001471485B|nr:hepatoma-derived growth factor-related protein 2-like [Thalassophryne amazonica]
MSFNNSLWEKSSDSVEGEEETQENSETQSAPKQRKLAGAITKLNPFRSAYKAEKQMASDDEDLPQSGEKLPGNKQNSVVEAMNKLNPLRSANKKDSEEVELLKEKQVEEKPKSQVRTSPAQRDRKDRSETPPVPPIPVDEIMMGSTWHVEEQPQGPEHVQENKHRVPKERKGKQAETPKVPARPSAEELNGAKRHNGHKERRSHQNQSDDEGLGEEDELTASENKTTHVKKHKHLSPFMAQAADKASSDDEGLKEDESSSKEENDEKTEKTQPKEKKPKKRNPFMPRVKARIAKKNVQDGAAKNNAENEGGKKSLFNQLEEFRVDPSEPEEREDFDRLMEWWRNVELWEDTPQVEDMTEKEEAKAFAVTADKVQKGIRVFNKLFSERAESLWQHVIDMNSIADALDKFNKNTKIAQITGGSTSAIGGVATIAGLALAPVTMGTSLIVTAVGLGVATAGSLTTAGAGISNQVNNTMDRKKVEKIVEDYQEKMVDLNKCLKFIKQGIENLRKFDLIKMRKHAYNRDFPVLSSSFYEDGAMAGKAILINASEIMRVVQIANVAGSTAARAVQIASMATGVLTGLFVGMDIYFVAKDSKILKKGAKSEFAAKIREVTTQLHKGLVELNAIREELQSTTTPENNSADTTATSDFDKKEKEQKQYNSEEEEEDEIDRIKKAMKKDLEDGKYV